MPQTVWQQCLPRTLERHGRPGRASWMKSWPVLAVYLGLGIEVMDAGLPSPSVGLRAHPVRTRGPWSQF